MTMKRIGLFVLLLGVLFYLAGCAAWKEQIALNKLNDPNEEFRGMSAGDIEKYNADPENEDKIVCKKEKPIGSNIPTRVCRKESAIASRADDDQRAVEEIVRNTPMPRKPPSSGMSTH